MPTQEIAKLRIALSPEGRRIFPRMSVLENLQMGATGDGYAHLEEDIERAFTLFPRLKERMNQRGGTLSGGEQQMLAIARALMGRPRLLLLDEPSMGLAPLVTRLIFDTIRSISAERVSILLIEQNARAALELAARAYVLESGRVTLAGPSAAILSSDGVRRAYLGE